MQNRMHSRHLGLERTHSRSYGWKTSKSCSKECLTSKQKSLIEVKCQEISACSSENNRANSSVPPDSVYRSPVKAEREREDKSPSDFGRCTSLLPVPGGTQRQRHFQVIASKRKIFPPVTPQNSRISHSSQKPSSTQRSYPAQDIIPHPVIKTKMWMN